AVTYINKLPVMLFSKGFATASVDSVSLDSVSAVVQLYLGKKYSFAGINVNGMEARVLEATGWNGNKFDNKLMDFGRLREQQDRILDFYEKNGYPFASIKLDSIEIVEEKVSAKLLVDRGLQYKIDSIRNYGKARLKKHFLYKYLGIAPGSIYNRDKLSGISRRLSELPYIQEEHRWDLTMLGTGATINLYLQPKRSSQVNFLIGFLPASTAEGKLQLTGDVNLNLKNSLGSGESILVNWQQLQAKSPRINLAYQHPYIFNSSFGIDFSFDLLKRDSSFLLINGQFGLQYILSANQSGKLFIQNQQSYLLPGGFDTNIVKQTRTLPQDIDVSAISLGIDYEFFNTDYRFNPRRGNEIRLITSAGIKKIKQNNEIANLRDPFDPSFKFSSLYDTIKPKSYQLRARLQAAHFFPSGKSNTLKIGVQAGIFQSQKVFRNELFQVGGYKLLRGFSEESVYADRFAVATAEYRFLFGQNSFFFLFSDFGITRTKFQRTDFSNSYIGTGLGLTFEAKFGLLNVSYAVGKRNDLKFDLRQSSKIHFGYINYF
ncbi:MAG: hypothetical protein ABIQ56_04395, partial [Chitinophagaceae bacterium]